MKRSTRLLLAASLSLCAVPWRVGAEVTVKTPGQDIRIGSGSINVQASGISAIATEGNTASVTVGGIDADADVQGVTVINGRVSIDGKEIPANVTRYKSQKTGTVYLIQRQGGSVSVTTDEGAKK